MRAFHEAVPGSAFWREAFALHGAATLRVLPRTLAFGAFAALVAFLRRLAPWLEIRSDLLQGAGLVLGLLLVFRSAAGYDRWWEARSLWGGIVNQSRNLVVAARAYGPSDREWQDRFARWVASFCHAARGQLRGQHDLPEPRRLLGALESERLAAAEHMPSYVSGRIAALLREARAADELDPFVLVQLERERAALLDHIGGCERILKTPIPEVYSVTIRRFIVIYLCTLPFALATPLALLSPAYVVLIAYPILSLEQIGAELQNPFVIRSLSHLDLDAICAVIEKDVEAPVERAVIENDAAEYLYCRPQ